MNVLIVTALYRTICTLTGLVLAYLGYRLFMNNINGNAGDVNAHFKSIRIVLRRTTPGTFFVLFGTVVISITAYRALDVEYKFIETDGEEVRVLIEKTSPPKLNERIPENVYTVSVPFLRSNYGESLPDLPKGVKSTYE